jgi:3',5'-cyclic AMP phosphodiesterase CpdA
VRIAHLPDLHFERHDHRIADALLLDVRAHDPDLVVVSGDFTQIGSRIELERFARPYISFTAYYLQSQAITTYAQSI